MTDDPAPVISQLQSRPESSRMQETSCKQCSDFGIWSNKNIGHTRARLDVHKRNLRSSIAQKTQQLQTMRQQIEEMHSELENVFQTLDCQLKTHPRDTIAVVQTCVTKFNAKSTQLQKMKQKMQLLKNELTLLHKMINTPMISSVQQPSTSIMKARKQKASSRSDIQDTTVKAPFVCGFPVTENIYSQLSEERAHTDIEDDAVNPMNEIENETDEEEASLINPRTTKEYQMKMQSLFGSYVDQNVIQP